MFYRHSVAAMREMLCDYTAKEDEKGCPTEAHILWMCDQIEIMSATKTVKVALKISRWIGWMYRFMEEREYWDNARSRILAKQDVAVGLDLLK